MMSAIGGRGHFLRRLIFAVLAFQIVPLWVGGYLMIAVAGVRVAQAVGVVQVSEYVAGTGSMYPTFPKGETLTNLERMDEIVAQAKVRAYPGGILFFGQRYFGRDLQRGDIVTFANQKTQEIVAKESGDQKTDIGFIKRVIGLPGERIEVRDGFVKVNGQLLDEPYIATPRSTYGGAFLPDCHEITIPSDAVIVMGDNRKGSNDSRFDVGFVLLRDISSVIPLADQSSPSKRDGLKVHWRDTSEDSKMANQPVLDEKEYIKLLNQKRQESGLKALSLEPKLSQSAKKRAQVIIKYNDLSFEATRSGYTMDKATSEVGYSNIIMGEAPTQGFFTADELIDNYFQFPQTKNFLLNEKYQDTGVSAQIGEINGCPVQVIVQHFGGYIPPTYTDQEKQGWQNLIDNTAKVLPGWESLNSNSRVNQEDLRKLLDLMRKRQSNATQILNKMKANLWLGEQEKAMINEDSALFEQIETLAKSLNNPS